MQEEDPHFGGKFIITCSFQCAVTYMLNFTKFGIFKKYIYIYALSLGYTILYSWRRYLFKSTFWAYMIKCFRIYGARYNFKFWSYNFKGKLSTFRVFACQVIEIDYDCVDSEKLWCTRTYTRLPDLDFSKSGVLACTVKRIIINNLIRMQKKD